MTKGPGRREQPFFLQNKKNKILSMKRVVVVVVVVDVQKKKRNTIKVHLHRSKQAKAKPREKRLRESDIYGYIYMNELITATVKT